MILTVTLNSALDRVLFIDEFRPGTTMRPHKVVESVGGKGFDASVVLQTLGAKNVALGVVAGLTGQQLARLLDGYGITHDLVWVDGETRIAHVIAETQHHRHSHLIAAGLSVSAEAYQTLLERYKLHLNQATWIIAGGSIAEGVPVEAYGQLAGLAQAIGTPILIDSFGLPLRQALPFQPAIIKMNQAEFNQTFEVETGNLAELAAYVRRVRDGEDLPALVITCGAKGILACTPAGTYLATTPPQPAINAAGAGDGASAALVWRLSQNDSWPDALRWAAATGAAVVLTEGTADCRWADIERLVKQTEVRVI